MHASHKRKGIWDCHLGTGGRGTWCFVNYNADAPLILITLAEILEEKRAQTFLTTDIVFVKQVLAEPGEGLKVKSFQAVFPSDYPDNQGWGVAEIYEVQESKTKAGEICHAFFTKFGVHRIGGPDRVMAIDVLPHDTTVIYQTNPPPRLYYGG